MAQPSQFSKPIPGKKPAKSKPARCRRPIAALARADGTGKQAAQAQLEGGFAVLNRKR
jgi:hypothetical protein